MYQLCMVIVCKMGFVWVLNLWLGPLFYTTTQGSAKRWAWGCVNAGAWTTAYMQWSMTRTRLVQLGLRVAWTRRYELWGEIKNSWEGPSALWPSKWPLAFFDCQVCRSRPAYGNLLLLFSVTRLRPDEIPERIVKFPQSFPANLDFPNFCFKNSQNRFYCIFINKYYLPEHWEWNFFWKFVKWWNFFVINLRRLQ